MMSHSGLSVRPHCMLSLERNGLESRRYDRLVSPAASAESLYLPVSSRSHIVLSSATASCGVHRSRLTSRIAIPLDLERDIVDRQRVSVSHESIAQLRNAVLRADPRQDAVVHHAIQQQLGLTFADVESTLHENQVHRTRVRAALNTHQPQRVPTALSQVHLHLVSSRWLPAAEAAGSVAISVPAACGAARARPRPCPVS